MTPFEAKLAEFAHWANAQSDPDIGAGVSAIIRENYVKPVLGIAGMSDGAVTVNDVTSGSDIVNAAQSTVGKLSTWLESVGNTIVDSATAYYTAQGKLADLKLLAKGSPATQVVNAGSGVIAGIPSNWLFWGAIAIGGLLFLTRRD